VTASDQVFVFIDSDVLRQDIDLDGLDWEYLRAYSQRTDAGVRLPNVVRLEVEKFIDDSLVRMAAQMASLHKQLLRHGVPPSPTGEGQDALRWRQRAKTHFGERLEWLGAELVPTPSTDNDAIVRALLAERRPFSKGGDKGYRDYLIWKTVLSAGSGDLRNPATAHFITNNLKDFGPGGRLDADLSREAFLAGLSVRLHGGLREFTERVARRALPVDEAATVALGKDSELQKLVPYVDSNLSEATVSECLESFHVFESEVERFVADWSLQDGEGGVFVPDPDDVWAELDGFQCIALREPSLVRSLGEYTVAFEALADLEVGIRTEGVLLGEREHDETWSEHTFKVGFTLDMSGAVPSPVGDVTLLA